MLLLATGCCFLFACNNKPADQASPAATDTTAAKPAKPQPSEFADPRYAEIGKKNLSALSSGDVDGMLSAYAENARFNYSSGDSLVGKTAIARYWKDRRSKVIDSLTYENDIWLPIKINQSQKGPDRPGIWLLSWYQVHVKYKNGKKLTFWIHADNHFDSADKIDLTVEYIDRAPINKALGK